MMTIKFLSALVFTLLFLAFGFIGCNYSNGKQVHSTVDTIPKPDISLPGNFSTQTKLKFDSALIPSFFKQYPKLKPYEKNLLKFYRARAFTYAWFDENGLLEQAGNLFNKIENIHEEGVTSQLFYEDALHRMMDNDSSEAFTEKENPSVELMLTAQYFFYAQKIWNGISDKALHEIDWDLPRKKLSYEAILDSLLEAPSSAFMRTEPVFRQYSLLKANLKKYRSIQDEGSWKTISPDKKAYRKGDSSKVIAEIRDHLFLIGDLPLKNNSPVYDDALETAVKKFQHRYGLTEDGIIGKSLIEELNYPLKKRIEQLIVNMERCRWLPLALRKDYFVVNIPEYRFHAFENDTLAWSMKVVVGTDLNKTAVFSGMMSNVVFSPYWNVPAGILNKEILPAIRRNSNYLENNHMEWNGKTVRQKPGPWNALGKVKFLFPNSHSIYLHDTPSKSLFSLERRAFSHGCIRVEDPRRLAIYVLRHQPEWTEEKIDEALNAEKEKFVKINQPIPVIITYLTAWVDSEGNLNFRKDIYKRDSRLAKMIIENSKL